MASKETILSKIQILITNHFEIPEEAFSYFDADGSGKLRKVNRKIIKTSRSQWVYSWTSWL